MDSKNPIKVVDLKTGYTCNNNCLFCAQASNRVHGDKDTNTIKKELLDAKTQGAAKIVFTGGEVTVRPDILELVRYAKKIGYSTIQIQTNGRTFYYKDFCKEMIQAGANEFGVSIHGHIPELHDYLTSCPGSFAQTYQGIKNLKGLGQHVITNTVVVKPNYRHLEQIAEMLVNLGVDQYQFAFVHAAGNAQANFDKMMPFVTIAVPYIHKGLQIGIDAGVKVMAEAMPYCMMNGYEKYVSELYIPRAQVKEYDFTISDFEAIRKTELKLKFPQCKKCRYDLVCEGPWKEYPQKKGSKEFQPVPGTKVVDTQDILGM